MHRSFGLAGMPVLLHPSRSEDAVGGLRLSEIGFPDIIIISEVVYFEDH
jgi:hypothetical protein